MRTKSNLICHEHASRDGISIIEVLVSLTVAVIGVFGVLVLIPFAVKQAQIGLDQDAADLIGRNAIGDLQTYGYTSVADTGQLAMRGSKVLVGGTDDSPITQLVPPIEVFGQNPPDRRPNFFPVLFLNGGLNAANPRIIHFDPLAVGAVGFPAANSDPNPDFLTGQLPVTNGPDEEFNDLRVTLATGICRSTFTQNTGSGLLTFHHLLDGAEANRLCRTEDDLIVSERNFLLPETANDEDALSGTDLPQPVFDVSVNNHILRRQTQGRISWSAIFVPVKDSNRVKTSPADPPTVATKYKVYVLVYKDRSLIPGDDESVMTVAAVNRYASGEAGSPPATTNGGYSAAVDQIHLLSPSVGVFKDDWVMLINRRPAPEYVPANANLGLSINNTVLGRRLKAEEAGYDTQIGFAKVISVLSSDTFDGSGNLLPDDNGTFATLSVAGGAFDFYYSDIVGTQGSNLSARGGTPNNEYGVDISNNPDEDFTTETYVINLKNVINVYERTIILERNSTWN